MILSLFSFPSPPSVLCTVFGAQPALSCYLPLLVPFPLPSFSSTVSILSALGGIGWVWGGGGGVTFRRVVVLLRGPGQSPLLPFACCVGSLRSVGRCGRCSCRRRFCVRRAQWLVCWGCAECGGMCCLRVSGAQLLAYWGCACLWRGWFACFCCPHTSVLRPSTTCLAAFLCA